MSFRYMNISQMAAMFDLSRPTVRKRLKAANLPPVKSNDKPPVYDMKKAGPALFSNHNARGL